MTRFRNPTRIAMALLAVILGILLVGAGYYRIGRSSPIWEELARIETAGWAHDIALDGNNVLVADREGGVFVIDRLQGWRISARHNEIKDVISLASSPAGPVLAASLDGIALLSHGGRLEGKLPNRAIANSVAVRGPYIFAAHGLSGLVVARFAPNGIEKVTRLLSVGWSHDIALWEHYALLTDWNYGLRIVDIADPEKPVEVRFVKTPATAIAVDVERLPDGRPMAAVAEGQGGVALIDLSDPKNPQPVARHSLGLNPSGPTHPKAGGWAHGVDWSGRYVFVANWKQGFTVLDVSDAATPRIVAEIPSAGTALAVTAETAEDGSMLLFLADGEAGLRVVRFRGER